MVGADLDKREIEARVLYRRATAAHARIFAQQTDTTDLTALATAIVELAGEAIGRGRTGDARRPITAADVFRAVSALRRPQEEGANPSPVHVLLDEVESHGRYLADKLGCDYEAFLSGPPRACDPRLAADALLNGCSGLVRLIEQSGQDDDDGPLDPARGALPAWALDQLGELGRIDPRLGDQLRRNLGDFRVTRQRPAAHALYRCLEDNRDVLTPAPIVVVGMPHPADCVAEQIGWMEAVQDRFGLRNVLVVVTEKPVFGTRGRFRETTRLFDVGERAPELSPEQRFSFLRDYLASTQPHQVLNCGSALMWDLFLEYGRPLSCTSRLNAVLLAGDLAGPDAPRGFAATHLMEALPCLEAVFVPNAGGKALLETALECPPHWADKIRAGAKDLLCDK